MAEPLVATSVFDRLLKDRIIWLGSEVRDDNANEICAKILLLAAEDAEKDIYLYINSPGGSITAGMAIYDTMQFVPNDIVTVGIGMAASMGQLLLTAGTKGKRYITPNARVLLHQPHGGFGGTASDIQTQAQLILDMKKRLAEITAAQTGKTVEQINADGDRDRWFSAEEALEYGFVDHIRESATDVIGAGPRPDGSEGERERTRNADPHLRTERPRPAGAPDARQPLHPPAVRGAHGLRLQAPGSVQQALRGPRHLPRRAGRRRVGR
jgi:ATP-dependent Clp protease protease subunit